MYYIYYILFFLSGFAALAAEIVWTRSLSLIFGSTIISLTIILTSFMAGLSLGSLFAGKFFANKKTNNIHYATIEFITAILVLISPFLMEILRNLYVYQYNVMGKGLLLFISISFESFVVIGLPAFFMGMTLPVLTSILPSDIFRTKVSLLYGVNTLGSAVGSAIVGFYMIYKIGMKQTLYLSAFVYLLISVVALFFKLEKQSNEESDSDNEEKDLLIYAIAFFAGFAAMAYEVMWTRLLVFFIGGTVYTYSIIITTFLMGVFFGTFILNTLLKKVKSFFVSFISQIGIAFFSIISILLIPIMPSIVKFIIKGSPSLINAIVSKIVITSFILFIPTVFMGMFLPSLIDAYKGKEEEKVGNVYGVNTMGNIFGSFLAGFVIIKLLGIVKGMVFLSLINIFVAYLIILKWRIKKLFYIILPISLSFIIFLIPFKPLIEYSLQYRKLSNPQISYYKEGEDVTVSVVNEDQRRYLFINTLEAGMVGGKEDEFYKYLFTVGFLFPALTSPKTIMQAGLGSGTSLYSSALFDFPQSVVCVELCKEVVEAVKTDISPYIGDVMQDKRVRIIVDDARNYLFASNDKYDLIISDVYISALTGTSFLYSKEYFEELKDNLNKGGALGVGVGQVNGTDRIILKTLTSVFPYVYLFYLPSLNQFFALCSNDPLEFDKNEIEKNVYPYKDIIYQKSGISYEEIVNSYVCDKSVIDSFFNEHDVPVNTDNNPRIDYHAIFWLELYDLIPFYDNAFLDILKR